MNGKILQKCIDKLKTKKDDADIQYVLGMLETLLEMQPEDKKICLPPDPLVPGKLTPSSLMPLKKKEMDEAAIMEAEMSAALNKIDPSAIQTEQP